MSVFSEHLRLTVLRTLANSPGYTANSSIVHAVCSELGLSATRDQVKTELAWLAEQSLISSHPVGDGRLVVATITDRGLDVAEGRAIQPGVQRPAPGA